MTYSTNPILYLKRNRPHSSNFFYIMNCFKISDNILYASMGTFFCVWNSNISHKFHKFHDFFSFIRNQFLFSWHTSSIGTLWIRLIFWLSMSVFWCWVEFRIPCFFFAFEDLLPVYLRTLVEHVPERTPDHPPPSLWRGPDTLFPLLAFP